MQSNSKWEQCMQRAEQLGSWGVSLLQGCAALECCARPIGDPDAF